MEDAPKEITFAVGEAQSVATVEEVLISVVEIVPQKREVCRTVKNIKREVSDLAEMIQNYTDRKALLEKLLSEKETEIKSCVK